MTARLGGKVAVITGGCSGIGLATVELFVANGARVIVADILDAAGAALQQRFPAAVKFMHCDVTQEEDIAGSMALAEQAFGGVDIVFNNAGAMGTPQPLTAMAAADWDAAMNLLQRSVMLGIKHAAPALQRRGGGAIVNTASVSGVTTIGTPAYCVAKAGVIHLTRLAALELAPQRIRVNAILPGIIPTPLFGNILGMAHEQSVKLVDELGDRTTGLQPLPRPGTTRDIAEACLYLASDASSFVTGIELRVDGGLTLKPALEMNHEQPGTFGHLLASTAGFLT